MLTGLLSGLKWINWLNTHGGWSETTPSPPFNYLWSLPPTLRYSETSGYISPLWKLVPLPLPPFAPGETALSQVSLRIRKPHWGIFRRILDVTTISIAQSNVNISSRIFEWKLAVARDAIFVTILHGMRGIPGIARLVGTRSPYNCSHKIKFSVGYDNRSCTIELFIANRIMIEWDLCDFGLSNFQFPWSAFCIRFVANSSHNC